MSDIANRLIPVNIGDGPTIQLNTFHFGPIVTAYLLGDINAQTGVAALNELLAMQQAPALSIGEQNDIAAMKAHYDTLNAINQAIYRDKLVTYTQYLQSSQQFQAAKMTVSAWDNFMGLTS